MPLTVGVDLGGSVDATAPPPLIDRLALTLALGLATGPGLALAGLPGPGLALVTLAWPGLSPGLGLAWPVLPCLPEP
jgi:hypothetical protein